MSTKKKSLIWTVVLSVLLIVIIWHVIHWHATGMYTRLSELTEEGKGYLSALYNLGLFVVSASVLGMLMSRITDLLTHEQLRSDGTASGEKGKEEQ